jgi:hypothetical protein
MHEWFKSMKLSSEELEKTKKAASRTVPLYAAAPYAATSYGFSRKKTNDSVSSMSISINTPSEVSELSDADIEPLERDVSFGRQYDEEELTFSISLKSSNAASSYLICQAASFNPDWMRKQDSKLFRCSCGNYHELDYTCKPPTPIKTAPRLI